jgi:hypothetical protein
MRDPFWSQRTESSGRFATAEDWRWLAGRQHRQRHRHRRHRPARRCRARPIAILCGCVGLMVLVVSLSSLAVVTAYQSYHRDTALAQEGMQSLQTAEIMVKKLAHDPFDAQSATKARQAFATALHDFSQLGADLNQLPGAATAVPKYGVLLSAAQHLVPFAVTVSQAGVIGCNALMLLAAHLANPLDTAARGIMMPDLTVLDQDVAQLQRLLNTAADQIAQLPPADLQADPRIGPAITTFRTALPGLQLVLQNVQTMLSVAPVLLGIGKPASYLLEQLDSTELRPGGGFIGTYGIATVANGRLANIFMTDVDLLDRPFEFAGGTIPFPPAYRWFPLAPTWSLRDSNLDADFPTAARYAEQIYHIEGGNVPLQGVIAITPWFIESALHITGPIYVSEYHETITAQNLIDRIHYHQLRAEEGADYVPAPGGHSSLRKRFTELLFEHFLARVRQVAPTAMPQFVQLLAHSLQTKDIQIYLNADAAEALLQRNHVAATIRAPAGDSLFVVDANIIANKANDFMTYTLHDQVTIDSAGTAVHHTTLTYAWPLSAASSQNDYGVTDLYRDYLRVYVPPGSSLQAQDGWAPQGTSVAFGREVWAGIFTLPYGQTKTIALTWRVPHAATKDATGWHYRYLLQRQAGVTWHLNLQMALPACAGQLSLQPPLHALKREPGGQVGGSLTQFLTTDLNIGVSYSCSR